MFGVGIVILGIVLAWVVFRGSKRNPGEASVESSERATRELYADEDRRTVDPTDAAP
jgi:hypothetical protein